MKDNKIHIDKVIILLRQDTIFDNKSQKIEITTHFEKDYPYVTLKTENWIISDNLDNMLNDVNEISQCVEDNLYNKLNKQ